MPHCLSLALSCSRYVKNALPLSGEEGTSRILAELELFAMHTVPLHLQLRWYGAMHKVEVVHFFASIPMLNVVWCLIDLLFESNGQYAPPDSMRRVNQSFPSFVAIAELFQLRIGPTEILSCTVSWEQQG
jgi:hypothetical protein